MNVSLIATSNMYEYNIVWFLYTKFIFAENGKSFKNGKIDAIEEDTVYCNLCNVLRMLKRLCNI